MNIGDSHSKCVLLMRMGNFKLDEWMDNEHIRCLDILYIHVDDIKTWYVKMKMHDSGWMIGW